MKKISFILAFAFLFIGMCIIYTSYDCTGFLCDIGAFLVALPWSKLWDFGGPLSTLSFNNYATYARILPILNFIGVLLNSIIIYFITFFLIKGLKSLVSKVRS
jgi:hypothetical protein